MCRAVLSRKQRRWSANEHAHTRCNNTCTRVAQPRDHACPDEPHLYTLYSPRPDRGGEGVAFDAAPYRNRDRNSVYPATMARGMDVERSAKRSADRSGEWRRERREGGGGRRAGGRGREGGRVGRELARENGVSARC